MWPDPGPEQETAYYRVHHTPGGNATFYNFPNDFSHICNLNLRRRLVLSEIDKIPFGWYHVQVVAVTGANFFADSYDLFTINSTIQLLGHADVRIRSLAALSIILWIWLTAHPTRRMAVLSLEKRALISTLSYASLSPSQILTILRDSDPELSWTQKDIGNLAQKAKLEELDGRTSIQWLLEIRYCTCSLDTYTDLNRRFKPVTLTLDVTLTMDLSNDFLYPFDLPYTLEAESWYSTPWLHL